MSINQGQHLLDAPHHEIHEGEMYSLSYVNSVANNAVLNMGLFIPPTAVKFPHLVWSANAQGDFELTVRESVTLATSGTPLPEVYVRRTKVNSSGYGTFHTFTHSADGAVLYDQLIAGGSGGNATGGETGGRFEFILAGSRWYSFALTNRGGTSKRMSLNLAFYTHA